MLGDGARDARRTELYLDGLLSVDDRRAADVPADTDLDPGVRLAAQRLRSDLVRVHPSFRFEEALSARLSVGAARLRAGLPVELAESPATAQAAITYLRHGLGGDQAATIEHRTVEYDLFNIGVEDVAPALLAEGTGESGWLNVR